MKNFYSFIITLSLALFWVRINDYIAFRGWLPVKVTRKIIHVGTGPFFMMCWVLFETESSSSSLYACIVPLLITIQFALVGFGIIEDKQAVQAISRSGDRRELLYGPLQYGFAHTLLTYLFWGNSVHGVLSLCMLCGGDGLAALVGEWIPSRIIITHQRSKKNTTKTLSGSLGCFCGSIFCSLIVCLYLSLSISPFFNIFSLNPQLLITIFMCSISTTITELYAPPDYDNVLIVIVSIITSYLTSFVAPISPATFSLIN